MHKDQAGLYIHVPFCLSKCGYCSFYSVDSPDLIPEFVKAVVREMSFYKTTQIPFDTKTLNSSEKNTNLSFPRKRESRELFKKIDSRFRGNDVEEYCFKGFDTIYTGGGTPSLLSIAQASNILEAAGRHFAVDSNAEITMEANPGDVSETYLRDLKAVGINRLNIGVQSFADDILRFLGRRHSAREAISAIDAARAAGFDNIGLDLIYGVAGQNIRLWTKTLEQALSFAPEHLSCYQLSLDEKTPLFARYRSDGLRMPTENEALDFFLTTSKMLTGAGYLHYEVSNFARCEALSSKHNMKYWRHIPYLGLGPAAHSFCDRRRWWNAADVDAYNRSIFEGKTPVLQSEELSAEQLAMEALFLGLRTKDGFDLGEYQTRYGVDLLEQKKEILRKLEEDKLVEVKDGRLRPTLSGMAVADSLALI